MKKILLASLGLLILLLCSCKEDKDGGFDMNFHDIQDIKGLMESIDPDLLELFGEENIHFGHTPPNINDISFKVDTLRYDTCLRYVYVPAVDSVMLSPSAPPVLENALYQHHFYHPIGNITRHKLNIHDRSYGNQYTQESDTVFIIGSGNSFTAYYELKIESEKDGNPTWDFLVSGTLVYDSTGAFIGVSGYRLGKKIVSVESPPTAGYYTGTIMIMESFRNGAISPQWEWDTIPDSRVYPY